MRPAPEDATLPVDDGDFPTPAVPRRCPKRSVPWQIADAPGSPPTWRRGHRPPPGRFALAHKRLESHSARWGPCLPFRSRIFLPSMSGSGHGLGGYRIRSVASDLGPGRKRSPRGHGRLGWIPAFLRFSPSSEAVGIDYCDCADWWGNVASKVRFRRQYATTFRPLGSIIFPRERAVRKLEGGFAFT